VGWTFWSKTLNKTEIKESDLNRALDVVAHPELVNCRDALDLFFTITGIGYRAEAFRNSNNGKFSVALNAHKQGGENEQA
jgi:hypothetical protein